MRMDNDNRFFIEDMIRTRVTPAELHELVVDTAKDDTNEVSLMLEREPGSQSGSFVSGVRANLREWSVSSRSPRTDKVRRAVPFSIAVNEGRVYCLNRDWTPILKDEYDGFEHDKTAVDYHDDIVDASVYAHMGCSIGNIAKGAGLRG